MESTLMGEVSDFLENMQLPEMRDNHYQHKHGYNKFLTDAQYDKLYNEQKGCCAICNMHQSEFTKRLAVDHDHETGMVRGLLCFKCNTGLGVYENGKEGFEKYLKKE